MPQNKRESGARKLVAETGRDPHDAFSQTAAENCRPRSGTGNAKPAPGSPAKPAAARPNDVTGRRSGG